MNLFMSILQWQIKSTDTSDHLFLVNVKIGECMGPYCEHEV